MKHPEYIAAAELTREHEDERDAQDARTSHAQLQRIYRTRETMLESVSAWISLPFREALQQKIAYEHSRLEEIAREKARMQAEKKRQNRRLNAQYFTLTPLEIDLL